MNFRSVINSMGRAISLGIASIGFLVVYGIYKFFSWINK